MAIGESPREHIPLRPEVKYVGNMHGDEVSLKHVYVMWLKSI